MTDFENEPTYPANLGDADWLGLLEGNAQQRLNQPPTPAASDLTR